jgi:hypothetical protein
LKDCQQVPTNITFSVIAAEGDSDDAFASGVELAKATITITVAEKKFTVTKTDFGSNLEFDTSKKLDFTGTIRLSSNYYLQGTIAEISLKKGNDEVNFGNLFKNLEMKTGDDESAQDYAAYYGDKASFNYGLYPDGTYAGDEFVADSSQDTTIEAVISDEAEAGTYTFTAVFKEIVINDGTTMVLETPLATLEITIEVTKAI